MNGTWQKRALGNGCERPDKQTWVATGLKGIDEEARNSVRSKILLKAGPRVCRSVCQVFH